MAENQKTEVPSQDLQSEKQPSATFAEEQIQPDNGSEVQNLPLLSAEKDQEQDNFFHTQSSQNTQSGEFNSRSITWEAPEFQNHEKNTGWYLVLFLVTIFSAILFFILTKSVMTLIVILLGGLGFGVIAGRKPNQLSYVMNDKGLRIGNKDYLFSEFRLFIVNPETSISELTLVPTKRFMPSLSIIFEQKDEQKILDILSKVLPYEERKQDFIDSLMHKLHF